MVGDVCGCWWVLGVGGSAAASRRRHELSTFGRSSTDSTRENARFGELTDAGCVGGWAKHTAAQLPADPGAHLSSCFRTSRMSRTSPTDAAKKPLFIVRHLARRPCCVCALSAGLGILLSGIFGVGFIVGFVPLGIDMSAEGMVVRGDAVGDRPNALAAVRRVTTTQSPERRRRAAMDAERSSRRRRRRGSGGGCARPTTRCGRPTRGRRLRPPAHPRPAAAAARRGGQRRRRRRHGRRV